jgi:hypothetical protein
MSWVSASYTYKSASVRRNRDPYITVSINRDFSASWFVKTAINVAKCVPFWGLILDLRGVYKKRGGSEEKISHYIVAFVRLYLKDKVDFVTL